MSGWSSSTIGIERRCNPMVRLDADDFVARLEAAVPPRPLNMNAIEPTNRGALDLSWAMPRGADPVPEISVDAVDELVSERVAIVDVREPEEFAGGHIPGSINIPQCDLALRLAEIAPETPTLVVCRAGARSYKAAQFLAERGCPLVASLRGGVEAWAASGRLVAVGEYSGAVDERRLAAIA
jgi:rhodanese-related sulfurtransferase